MGRSQLCRRVMREPGVTAFKPAGVPASSLGCVDLALDELEAVRLADLEGLYHEEAARRMRVSRQTFGRIIGSARRKIGDALVNGKVLFVRGGHVRVCRERRHGGRCAPQGTGAGRGNGGDGPGPRGL